MAVTPMRTFNLRLTDEEMAAITAKAKDLGLSKAGLIRRLLERAGLVPETTKGQRRQPADPPKAGSTTVEPRFKA